MSFDKVDLEVAIKKAGDRGESVGLMEPLLISESARQRTALTAGERLDATKVAAPGGGGEVADGHFLDHAPPHRADGLMRKMDSHRMLPS